MNKHWKLINILFRNDDPCALSQTAHKRSRTYLYLAALSSTAMAVGEWQFAMFFRASILDGSYRGLWNQFIKCRGHARGYLLLRRQVEENFTKEPVYVP
ncbi:MAG TPA: hypothetical protein DD723_01570 [Candidatus Omnitrophica bacterium]|nr:hypothetical protein [Candidatus Omnitrophota bacterium]